MSDRHPQLTMITPIAGAVAVAIGAIVLLGWALDLAPLTSGFPGLIPMPANTAVGFVLVGLALWLLATAAARPRRRLLGLTLAFGALQLGLLTTLQYLGGWDFGIDTLLHVPPQAGLDWGHAGRPSLMAAIDFTLVGLALLLTGLRPERQSRVAQGLALAAGAIAFATLLGYLLGVLYLQRGQEAVDMALLTAVGFQFVAIGLLLIRPRDGWVGFLLGASPGAGVARRLLPAAVFLPLLVGWAIALGQSLKWFDTPFGLALVVAGSMLGLVAMAVWAAMPLDRSEAERRQRERALRASEQKFRSVVASANDAIILADGRGRIISWNHGAERLFGYEEHEVINEPLTLIIPEPMRQAHIEGMSRVQRGEAPRMGGKAIELRGLRKDGTEFPAELSISTWTTGGERYFSGVIRDVSERRALARMQEEFLSTISHELRSPLNMVAGALDMLASGMLPPERSRRMVEIAFKSSQQLIRLVDDLLDSQMIQWGRLRILRRRCELLEILEQATEALRPAAEEAGLRLEVAGEEATVEVDCLRVVQTLTNLISNAIKFSPPGTTIRVSGAVSDESIELRVADEGRGIPEDKHELIFERFGQIEIEDAAVKRGAGLGLAICRAIVEQHGGRIRVESRPGHGSTFIVVLPRFQSGSVVSPDVAPRTS